MWAGMVLLAVPFISCKSPVYVQQDNDVDMNNYKSYMWVVTKKSDNDPSARASAYADISVRNYVNAELRNLGWREVTESPDALVTYDILVERTVEQQSDPVYTQPFTRYYYNPYSRRWNALHFPSRFLGYDTYEVPVKEGTITITVIDAKTDKNVWQGWTSEEMNYTRFTDVEIGRSVQNIFRKFDEAVAAR
jgi:hypothetical protein